MERLRSDRAPRLLLGDGAMGTELIRRGLPPGVSSFEANCEHPELVQAIHRDYVEAAADVILTNSFLATELFACYVNIFLKMSEVYTNAVTSFPGSHDEWPMLFGAFGPVDLRKHSPESVFQWGGLLAQIRASYYGGTRVFFETQTSLEHMLALAEGAVHEIKRQWIDRNPNCQPCELWVSCACEPTGADPKLLAGGTLGEAWRRLAESPAAEFVTAFGANCVAFERPGDWLPLIDFLDGLLPPNIRLIVKPSAPPGFGPEDFALVIERLRGLERPSLLAGCCGTTPEWIARWREMIDEAPGSSSL